MRCDTGIRGVRVWGMGAGARDPTTDSTTECRRKKRKKKKEDLNRVWGGGTSCSSVCSPVTCSELLAPPSNRSASIPLATWAIAVVYPAVMFTCRDRPRNYWVREQFLGGFWRHFFKEGAPACDGGGRG